MVRSAKSLLYQVNLACFNHLKKVTYFKSNYVCIKFFPLVYYASKH